MSLSLYLWGIRLFTLLSLCAWFGIVIAIDPAKSGTLGTVLFFTSFFAVIQGVMTLFMTWLYRRAIGATSAAHHLGSAFRQAFFLTLFVVGLAFFQKERILTWWDAALLLAALLLCEFSVRKLFSQNDED